MDVSAIVAQQTAAQEAKYKSVAVEKDIPLEADVGLLAITDPNPIDVQSYNTDREAHLQALARDGVQSLIAQVFALPTQSSIYGPLAILPSPTTRLPRAKPLPKPKALTKWQKFANAKGIQHRDKVNKVWDEEKQGWVRRWGRDAKNKEKEQQWLHVIPENKPDDWDAATEARKARKERTAKNEEARLKNLAHTARTTNSARRDEIDRAVARTRMSTASMGKFDRELEGEKKPRGVKRKFAPAEVSNERDQSLALISKLDGQPVSKKVKPSRPDPGRTSEVLNVRKAIRSASKGEGSLALARSAEKASAKPKKVTKSSKKRHMKRSKT